MEEIWRDIEGFEGKYQISNLGRVKSLARKVKARSGSDKPIPETILKPFLAKGFYYQVTLCDGGNIKKTARVSRLVGIAFIPNPNNYPNVLHRKETLPLDELHAVDNLFWGNGSR